MKRVLAAFARNTVFANIILVLIFLSGTPVLIPKRLKRESAGKLKKLLKA